MGFEVFAFDFGFGFRSSEVRRGGIEIDRFEYEDLEDFATVGGREVSTVIQYCTVSTIVMKFLVAYASNEQNT